MDYTRPVKRMKLHPTMVVPECPNTLSMNWLISTLMYPKTPGTVYTFMALLPRHNKTKEISEIAAALHTIHMFLKAKYGEAYPKIEENINEIEEEEIHTHNYTYTPSFFQSVKDYLCPPITPDITRISEDMGVFDSKHYKIVWLFPGDGCVPHASYLQSIYGGISILIDPEYDEAKFTGIIREGGTMNSVPLNLFCYKSTMESFLDRFIPPDGTNIIVSVCIHSHHNSDIVWDKIEKYNLPHIYLTIPCCKGFKHYPSKATPSYDQTNEKFRLGNTGILSPKNRVMIYRNKLVTEEYKYPIVRRRF